MSSFKKMWHIPQIKRDGNCFFLLVRYNYNTHEDKNQHKDIKGEIKMSDKIILKTDNFEIPATLNGTY